MIDKLIDRRDEIIDRIDEILETEVDVNNNYELRALYDELEELIETINTELF
jgi:uncharacterized coiled-coil DUF342 family protein